MSTRREALALARQIRGCPPARIKNDPRFTKQIRRHMETCPFCATRDNEEFDAWLELADTLKQEMKADKAAPVPVPGQVWSMDPGLACFRGDEFFNPPWVLVLAAKDGADKAVTVAQVYEDIRLAGPGDLVPPLDMTETIGELFIEPWNVYTVEKSFLATCLGNLGHRVAKAVRAMDENPDDMPDWAMTPMPMASEDARIYFRELEMETGFTFASMAAGQLLSELERDLFPMGTAALMAAVRRKISGITWEWEPQTVIECLATLCFPSHALPMQAADSEKETITASYVCFGRGGGLEAVRPVQCPVDYATYPPKPYSVSGTIGALPGGISDAVFQCYIKDGKNKRLFPCQLILEGTGRFMAVFRRPLKAHERPVLFIIHNRDSD